MALQKNSQLNCVQLNKSIFNSLGSNYDWSFSQLALKQLLWPDDQARTKLTKLLTDRFAVRPNQVQLCYQAREALELILRAYQIGTGDQVLTQAFSCYAIEEAITNAGAQPIYVDLAANQLNLSMTTLRQSFKRASQAKAVIVQYTLGSTVDIEAIRNWCHRHQLILIEDLAQGYGGTSPDGKKLGLFGDAVLLSFGRDKIIDGVSGGAAIVRKSGFNHPSLDSAGQVLLIRNLVYASLTNLIRATYDSGLGKLIHFVVKKIGLLVPSTATANQQPTSLPNQLASLTLDRFKQLKQNLAHRKKISQIYANKLTKLQLIKLITDEDSFAHGANLRIAISTNSPESLIDYLANYKLHLADRWYQQPVDCGSISCQSQYRIGSCPNAERLAQQVVNLPTHQQITPAVAEKICQLLKNYERLSA